MENGKNRKCEGGKSDYRQFDSLWIHIALFTRVDGEISFKAPFWLYYHERSLKWKYQSFLSSTLTHWYNYPQKNNLLSKQHCFCFSHYQTQRNCKQTSIDVISTSKNESFRMLITDETPIVPEIWSILISFRNEEVFFVFVSSILLCNFIDRRRSGVQWVLIGGRGNRVAAPAYWIEREDR